MEHKEIEININQDESKYIRVEHNVGTLKVTTMNCMDTDAFEGVDLELTDDVQHKLVNALLSNLLEKGHFDKAIKGWISANMLDGDAFNDCGKTKLTLTPEDLYETIYDCIDGITGV